MKPLVLRTAEAEVHIYRHGAHITHFQPRGHRPVLFLSAKSRFEPQKPIRGGVPICFPWFGRGNAPAPQLPLHGLARLQQWDVSDQTPNSILLGLQLPPWTLRYRVEVSRRLVMTLEGTNNGTEPAQFEEALHTYLAVGDIRAVTVTGLEDTDYLDNLDGLARKHQGRDEPIRFTGQTDRVYLNTRAACIVHDPALGRKLIVEKDGSDATVVWNPWEAGAKAMPDFGDEEWRYMLCIETANCKQHAVTLAPGKSHRMTAVISVA
ncbi:MAG: D-hexose-6-phosphate mutarotase [Verrucomicrobiae bacterium]|nr:D-hexose-6-phosphate mutarotase [Verrucomicrobiae bacterium]